MTSYPNKPPIAVNLRRLKSEAGVTWREIATALDKPERNVQEWARADGAQYVASWEACCLLAMYFTEKLGRRIEPGHFYLDPIEEMAA